jgi:hypothetical protein
VVAFILCKNTTQKLLDAYREFNNGIESFLQEEKKDSRYFEHLMKAQTANLIVKRE